MNKLNKVQHFTKESLERSTKIGPAYNATLRQCDNATIHDFILILASHFIFNKVRHLQVSPRQVKINIMRHNVENGVKINKMRQCPFLKQ